MGDDAEHQEVVLGWEQEGQQEKVHLHPSWNNLGWSERPAAPFSSSPRTLALGWVRKGIVEHRKPFPLNSSSIDRLKFVPHRLREVRKMKEKREDLEAKMKSSDEMVS